MITFSAGVCDSPLSAKFLNNVVIRYTQGCTTSSPPFQLKSGNQAAMSWSEFRNNISSIRTRTNNGKSNSPLSNRGWSRSLMDSLTLSTCISSLPVINFKTVGFASLPKVIASFPFLRNERVKLISARIRKNSIAVFNLSKNLSCSCFSSLLNEELWGG